MVRVSMNVMALETMTGQLWIRTPNTNQSATPLANATYMMREMPLVSLWRMICSAWGTKAAVVSVAARAETTSSMATLSAQAPHRSPASLAALRRYVAKSLGEPGYLLAI